MQLLYNREMLFSRKRDDVYVAIISRKSNDSFLFFLFSRYVQYDQK